MQTVTSKAELENKRKGMATSLTIHLFILILLIIPFIRYQVPPPGQKGILVSLGAIDTGQGDDRPDTQNEELVEKATSAAKVEEQEETQPDQAARSAQKVATEKEVLTTQDPAEIALEKKRKEEARQKAIQRQKEIDAQRERDRLAEDARKKRAAEEAAKKAAFEETKKQYSNLLGGSGKGNTSTAGNQGDPNGDPNALALEGVSTGSGMVGGGLGDRGVLREPNIRDQSQKTGRVVVNVCVDAAGEVISAKYTQRGSTTTDSDLRVLAERSARQFRFTESDIEKQCGTVTIDFKLR